MSLTLMRATLADGVIASESEAIQIHEKEHWIASSLLLLAMAALACK
jgi:hypothetical protein